jgi:hypothetical protein
LSSRLHLLPPLSLNILHKQSSCYSPNLHQHYSYNCHSSSSRRCKFHYILPLFFYISWPFWYLNFPLCISILFSVTCLALFACFHCSLRKPHAITMVSINCIHKKINKWSHEHNPMFSCRLYLTRALTFPWSHVPQQLLVTYPTLGKSSIFVTTAVASLFAPPHCDSLHRACCLILLSGDSSSQWLPSNYPTNSGYLIQSRTGILPVGVGINMPAIVFNISHCCCTRMHRWGLLLSCIMNAILSLLRIIRNSGTNPSQMRKSQSLGDAVIEAECPRDIVAVLSLFLVTQKL